ncbi:MAG: hydroxyacid dehydrogenase [Planctomycetes bacterium]|nr:hydroxyacid dehydrogenase [Planctomycetota bacterium]
MKILVCDPIDEQGLARLRGAGHLVDAKLGLAPEALLKEVAPYDCIVVRSSTKITKAVVDAAKALRVVVRGGVGMDNIDAVACEARGIKVLNTPEAATISVAELAIGLMFACARRIGRAHELMRQGKWEKKALTGNEVTGRTLGLIGVGRIGSEVAIRARALGMRVIGFDPYLKSAPPALELTNLDAVLSGSDYLSVHVPFTPETKHMIGAAAFEKMRKGVMLIDCARGGIVDEPALAEALKSGKVAMAAMDVFEEEPLKPDHPLLKLDNVILTPHIGASTHEGQGRVGMAVAEKLIQMFGPANA